MSEAQSDYWLRNQAEVAQQDQHDQQPAGLKGRDQAQPQDQQQQHQYQAHQLHHQTKSDKPALALKESQPSEANSTATNNNNYIIDNGSSTTNNNNNNNDDDDCELEAADQFDQPDRLLLTGQCATGVVAAAAGLLEERVKVDRKRFEQMLGDGSTMAGCDADSFFRRVMRSTNTQIMWPPKLKPGTKSKKDPHVRITGSPNSINAAKEIIFEQLDTRRNRVTLKMDVAFTDHSHIIGKGGRSIQRVMDETGCHIHFPDSNRTNTAEKSNQVSIAGSAEGVEQSRCRIREMLPIAVQFDLPLNNGLHSPPTLDPQSPQLQAIQQSYGITITFRSDGSKQCQNNSYFASSRIITVAVRGARSHLFGLRQGLAVLIEYLTGFRANTINVPLTMTIDVAVQHHSFIAGRANCNIKSIMQSSGSVITMPDLGSAGPANGAIDCSASSTSLSAFGGSSSCLSAFGGSSSSLSALGSAGGSSSSLTGAGAPNRKTAILIEGPNFESVYSAWQDLLGYLPLILIFDLKEGQDLDAVQVTKLMEQMRQISILIKPKQRQNTKSIVVRGPEKDSRLLFEARRQVLKLDDSELPTSYSPLDQLLTNQQQQLHATINNNNISSSSSSNNNINNNCSSNNSINNNSVTFQEQASQQQLVQQVANNGSIRSPQQPQPAHLLQQQQQQQHVAPSLPSSELQMKAIRAILEPNLEKARHPTPFWAGLGFSKSVSEPMNSKEKLFMGPLFTSNLSDERRTSYANEGAIHDLANSLHSLSIDDQHHQQQQQLQAGKLFTDLNNNSNNNSNTNSGNTNMQSQQPSSLSSHHHHQQQHQQQQQLQQQHHPGSNMNTNITTTTTTNNMNNNTRTQTQQQQQQQQQRQKISSCLRLAVFLGRIGLVQHLGLFTQHNIDLEMLFSLTEADFAELGLPYIHRRKLAIAISEVKTAIQNEQQRCSQLAAGGVPATGATGGACVATLTGAFAGLTSSFDAAPGAERSKRQKATRGSIQGELSDIWST